MRTLALLIVAFATACGGGQGGVTGPADAGSNRASDTGNNATTANSNTIDGGSSDTDGSTEGDSGADMAPPVELDHFLYVVELGGVIHWYDLSDPGSPDELGSEDVSGRVTFGTFHPSMDRFYVTNETRIEGYAIDNLAPTNVGSASTVVGGTHLEVTTDGNAVISASYGGDSVVMNPLQDGVPQAATQTLGGAGSGVCDRAHQVRVHPGGRWVYVPCLANDHVAIFEWDGTSLTSRGSADTAGGMGPRHLDFHPTLDIAYVLGESNSTVEVFDLDTATGQLSRKQTTSTMADRTGASASSDIHVSPDGRFLYAMNRQPIHDLALFEIDQTTGELTWVENVDSGGEHSRSFTIHPDQTHLYVGNSDTRDMTIFEVGADGRLTSAGSISYGDRIWFVGVWSR